MADAKESKDPKSAKNKKTKPAPEETKKAEVKSEAKAETKSKGKKPAPEAKAEDANANEETAQTEGAKVKAEKSEKTDKSEKGDKKRKRPGPASRRAQSKRHQENLKKVDPDKRYSVVDAVNLLKSAKGVKFDETIQIVMKLGVDTKKSDQLVRGSVSLPKGIGKTLRVLVFADGEQAEQAKSAGADHVGGKELIDKIHDQSWVDFDVAIALPSMMRFVGKLGKVLGPKGMMPSPKSGTVTEDVITAVREFKAGKVEYRTDAGGNVHAPVGKKSFPAESLVTNIEAFIEHIKSTRPSAIKGVFIQKVAISSTMGPGVTVDFKN